MDAASASKRKGVRAALTPVPALRRPAVPPTTQTGTGHVSIMDGFLLVRADFISGYVDGYGCNRIARPTTKPHHHAPHIAIMVV
jgi:hypothetical protein